MIVIVAFDVDNRSCFYFILRSTSYKQQKHIPIEKKQQSVPLWMTLKSPNNLVLSEIFEIKTKFKVSGVLISIDWSYN